MVQKSYGVEVQRDLIKAVCDVTLEECLETVGFIVALGIDDIALVKEFKKKFFYKCKLQSNGSISLLASLPCMNFGRPHYLIA